MTILLYLTRWEIGLRQKIIAISRISKLNSQGNSDKLWKAGFIWPISTTRGEGACSLNKQVPLPHVIDLIKENHVPDDAEKGGQLMM